jgi:hypothetical protein
VPQVTVYFSTTVTAEREAFFFGLGRTLPHSNCRN